MKKKQVKLALNAKKISTLNEKDMNSVQGGRASRGCPTGIICMTYPTCYCNC